MSNKTGGKKKGIGRSKVDFGVWLESLHSNILPISSPFEHCVLREIMRSTKIIFAIVLRELNVELASIGKLSDCYCAIILTAQNKLRILSFSTQFSSLVTQPPIRTRKGVW